MGPRQGMLSLKLSYWYSCKFVWLTPGAVPMSGCDFRHLCILVLPLLRVSAVLSALSPMSMFGLRTSPLPICSLNMLTLAPQFFLIPCIGFHPGFSQVFGHTQVWRTLCISLCIYKLNAPEHRDQGLKAYVRLAKIAAGAAAGALVSIYQGHRGPMSQAISLPQPHSLWVSPCRGITPPSVRRSTSPRPAVAAAPAGRI